MFRHRGRRGDAEVHKHEVQVKVVTRVVQELSHKKDVRSKSVGARREEKRHTRKLKRRETPY